MNIANNHARADHGERGSTPWESKSSPLHTSTTPYASQGLLTVFTGTIDRIKRAPTPFDTQRLARYQTLSATNSFRLGRSAHCG